MKYWNTYKIVTLYRENGRWKSFTDIYDGYDLAGAIDRWRFDNLNLIQGSRAHISNIYRETSAGWEVVEWED